MTPAADALWQFQQGSAEAPADLFEPLSIDDGLAVQRELHLRRVAAGAVQVGWKVGLTSPRARDAVGSDSRPFGHLTKLLRSGAVVGATAPGTEESGPAESSMGGRLSVEPEMCFEIAEPLGDHVDPADVPGRIASACAGFEINERRVRAAGNPALLVADNLTNWAVVRGGGVPPPAAAALDDTRVVLTCDGETRLDCRGADHLDNPYESIAALCATLGSHGLSLRPGDLVITGAYARFDLAAGETWRAEYSGIGAVELRVAAEDSRTAAA